MRVYLITEVKANKVKKLLVPRYTKHLKCYNLSIDVGVSNVLAPAIISLLVSEWFRKKGWIKLGDMQITYE